MTDDEILLPPEVAARLRVALNTLAHWRSPDYTGPTPPKWLRLGAKKVGYLSSEVEAYIKRMAALAGDEQDQRRSA